MSVWLAEEIEKIMATIYRGRKPEEIREFVRKIEEMRQLNDN